MTSRVRPIRFGSWELRERVGRGGMGEAFVARRLSPRDPREAHPPVVLKRMHPWLLGDPASAQMLLDEARIALRLDHPNIVRTFETGVVDGAPYLVMERLEGRTLGELVARTETRDGRLPTDVALYVVGELLEALAYAHRVTDGDGAPLGLVHRDVCPQNVFVTFDGQIKLLDFGIAKTRANVAQTEVGVVKGRAGYMAPEQALEMPVTPRSDLFAVGVVLWELLAGRRLYEASCTASAIVKLITGVAPRLADVAPDVDSELVAIVDRAIATDPAARFPSASAFRSALDACAVSHGRSLGLDALAAEPLAARAPT